MPLGIIGRVGPGMRQIVGFGDRSMGRGTFWGKFGKRHCNQLQLHDVCLRQCLNSRSCRLGWCVRWAEALLYYMGPHCARGRRGFGGFFVPHFHNGKCH